MNEASSAGRTESIHPPIYPADLQPALQEALAILADIDFQFAQQREQLLRWNGPESAKENLAEDIDREHRCVREPYMRLLAELQRRMMSLTEYASPH